MKPAFSTSKKAWRTLVCVLLALILFGLAITLMLIHLEDQVIMAYDEARHGVSAYEMIRNGDYLVHTYQGEPDLWNLKPPLSFWLIALHFKLFGYHCVAFRLHSVIATCVLLLAVTLWVQRRHGATAGLLALAFLVVNPALYGLNFSRTGEADALHTLFTTLSMLCLLNSERDSRWLYGSALGFSLSFLAKSFHAAIIPVMCLAYLLCTGGIRRLKVKNYLLLLLFGLLPILPWAIARYARDGFTFLSGMYATDVQARVTVENPAAGWDFYLLKLLANPAVVAYSLLCGAAYVWRRVERRKPSAEQVGMLIWFALPVLLYSMPASKLYHYIVPVMVPISMGGGLAALSLWRRLESRGWKAAVCLLLATGFIWLLAVNTQAVLGRDDKGSMQSTLAEALDRELDSEKHMYIQYNNGRTVWMQNDMLRALLSGDVVCLDGGVEAFEADEDYALLVIDRQGLDDTLLEYYPVYYESGYQLVLEN